MFPLRWVLLLLQIQSFIACSNAYKPLSNSFLGSIQTFDHESLLSPILIPRIPGTAGHSMVQHHFINFFRNELPKWTIEWYNSSTTNLEGKEVPIANLVLSREPPWTRKGQANWLTLAAHYDSKGVPEDTEAVPCAILMHVAAKIDQYMTQMHKEMAELGEGGTVEMDMGVQILLLDGKESFGGADLGLYGSTSLSKTWEEKLNPPGSKYPTALSQINMLVLLDSLGSINPTVPSYLRWTSWAHRKMASLEDRLRKLQLLETSPKSPFIPNTRETAKRAETDYDHIPFMKRGVPFLHVLPSPPSLPSNRRHTQDKSNSLDLPTVRDWAKIMTGFALEWLDMMEVWPDSDNDNLITS